MAGKFTAQQVADALLAAHGLKAPAAKILGCNRMTVAHYCKRYALCQTAADEASETVLDFGEGRLFEAVDKREPWAIAFLLKTKGKQRGYTEKTIIEGGDPEKPIQLRHTDERTESATREYLRSIAGGGVSESGGPGVSE